MKFKTSESINQRIERITTSHLVIGIDIAKDTHVAGAVNFRGIQLGRTISFSNNQSGYEKLMNWVHELQRKFGLSQVIFGAESTGHYFLNLAFWLLENGEEIVLVSPVTTKRNKENRDNKPSKNDAKDAIIIADNVSRGYYSEWVVHETIYRKLRYSVNEREALSVDLSAIGNQLQTLLDQAFPEFTSVFKEWDGVRAITTLKAFALPEELKELTIDEVIEGWRKAGMQRAGGSRGRASAAQLIHAARRSVGLKEGSQEMKRQIERLLARFELIRAQIEEVDLEIAAALKQVPCAARKPMEEMGFSSFYIAVILASAGDLSRYRHGLQFLALAGLNLAESTSGKRKGQVVLSKRGRRQLRKYLYLMVVGLVSYHEAFKRWHEYNVKTLKMKKQKSIFKLIGKLARILVALAHSGETFKAEKANSLVTIAA